MGIPAELDIAIIVVKNKRTVLVDESVKARATGSPIKPENEWIMCGVVFRFDKVVVEMTAALPIDCQVSGMVLRFETTIVESGKGNHFLSRGTTNGRLFDGRRGRG